MLILIHLWDCYQTPLDTLENYQKLILWRYVKPEIGDCLGRDFDFANHHVKLPDWRYLSITSHALLEKRNISKMTVLSRKILADGQFHRIQARMQLLLLLLLLLLFLVVFNFGTRLLLIINEVTFSFRILVTFAFLFVQTTSPRCDRSEANLRCLRSKSGTRKPLQGLDIRICQLFTRLRLEPQLELISCIHRRICSGWIMYIVRSFHVFPPICPIFGCQKLSNQKTKTLFQISTSGPFFLSQKNTWLISSSWSCPFVGRMVRSTLMSWGTISIHPVAMKTRLLVSKGSETNEFSVGMLGNVLGKLPGLLVKIHRKFVILWLWFWTA